LRFRLCHLQRLNLIQRIHRTLNSSSLRHPAAHSPAVIALAQHFQDGTLTPSLLLTGSDSQVADALIAVRGIGRWTVDMFLIFTLRRPDVLPVGDLGVQKGLLRWVLAAHGALPPSVPKSPKTPKGKGKGKEDHTPSDYGGGGVTLTPSASMATIPATPTPSASPLAATASFTTATPPWNLVTPTKLTSTPSFETPLPSTPAPPALTPSASTLLPAPVPTPSKLPAPAPDSILTPPPGWDKDCAHRAAPLPDGLSVEMLRSRLAGKKAK
jgi:DNA-3-methyladenine glycosylase II